MHIRRRVLRGLLLHGWWWDVLLLRRRGASLPCPGPTKRIADARLTLRRGSGTDATGCLQLLRLGRRLLVLDWRGWWRLHWWCLRLLYLPSLGHLLLLLAIRIRHRVHCDVSMWIESNANTIRCGSAILS